VNPTKLANALVLLAAFSGCHASHGGESPVGPPVPNDTVTLTQAQVDDAKIVISTVADQDVDDTILTSGRVSFDDLRVAHVFSPVTGRVVRIDAELGKHVKKGEELATIESPDVGNAVSDMHKANADLIAAQHDIKRQQDLFLVHAVSAATVEQSEDNYRKSKAEMERAERKAILLRAGGVNAVTQTYTLYSAIEGEVLARAINPGVEVQGQYTGGATVELFTIGDLSKVWVFADIYEMDLARMRVGTTAKVTVVSQPGKVFEGKVDWVANMLDPTTRTAKVRCSFDNPEMLLKPEMYATVQVSVQSRRALAIPRTAVFRLGDTTVAFVQKSAEGGNVEFERTPVKVDEAEGSKLVVVEHGLERGQKIVESGGVLLLQKL
jgi:membrane fusion protein, heavy metal efflux system